MACDTRRGRMHYLGLLFLVAFAGGVVCASGAGAAVITGTLVQVGGFLDTGLADNDPIHQNYFVGYGTVPGYPRSTERRSFFWYHIPAFAGVIDDVNLKLENLAYTSLVFGLDPVDPMVHDMTEDFQLGTVFVPPTDMTDTGLTSAEKQTIFDAMDDHPIAAPYVFDRSIPYTFPMTTEIHFDAAGIGLIDMSRGADIVLTGWMPTWSNDTPHRWDRPLSGGGRIDFRAVGLAWDGRRA